MRYYKKDTAKWVFTGIAIFIIIAAIVILSLQIFGQGKTRPSEWFRTEQTEVVDKTDDMGETGDDRTDTDEGGETPAPETDGDQGEQEGEKTETPADETVTNEGRETPAQKVTVKLK